MPVASRIVHYFNDRGISYQPLHHPRSVKMSEAIEHVEAVPELCIKSVILVDRRGAAQAVLPYLAELDLELINSTLNRQFQMVSETQASRLFKDCEPNALPAFGMAYGLPVIVDADLLSQDHIFASCGCSNTLMKMEQSAFSLVMKGAVKAHMAKWPKAKVAGLGTGLNACSGSLTLDGVARKLESVYNLPPMPETAVRIMHLISDPDADIDELAAVIERDPSLAAQIMRYARSALFAYPGELNNVKEAVNRVLGFDRVSKLAMGLAAAKAFTIPKSGALGVDHFWKHALYSAVLCQALAPLVNVENDIDDKEAYLSGLLHNFGVLLIGHLFPPEFKMLNKLREMEPDATMRDIEQQVFGIGSAQEFISLGHGAMGGILLKMWGLPEATVKCAAMHQNPDYQGDYQHQVQLIQLVNAFLSEQGVGDEPALGESGFQTLIDSLGIDETRAREVVELTLEQCHSLDSMIGQMAA